MEISSDSRVAEVQQAPEAVRSPELQADNPERSPVRQADNPERSPVRPVASREQSREPDPVDIQGCNRGGSQEAALTLVRRVQAVDIPVWARMIMARATTAMVSLAVADSRDLAHRAVWEPRAASSNK